MNKSILTQNKDRQRQRLLRGSNQLHFLASDSSWLRTSGFPAFRRPGTVAENSTWAKWRPPFRELPVAWAWWVCKKLACFGAILGLLERLQLKLTIYFNKFKSSWVLLGGRTNFFLCQLRDGWVLRNNQQIATRFTKSQECDQCRHRCCRRWLLAGVAFSRTATRGRNKNVTKCRRKKISSKNFGIFFFEWKESWKLLLFEQIIVFWSSVEFFKMNATSQLSRFTIVGVHRESFLIHLTNKNKKMLIPGHLILPKLCLLRLFSPK